jgi:hypothetical protein
LAWYWDDVRQLHVLPGDGGHGRRGAGLHERLALHVGADLQQVVSRKNTQGIDQGRLRGVVPRDHQRTPGVSHRQGRGQDLTHGPKLPGQGQLAHELQAQASGGIELARRGQDTERDGQIEASAFLGQIDPRRCFPNRHARHFDNL